VPLLHVPPGVASCKVVVPPTHMLLPPMMAAGKVFTVTGDVMVQPGPSE
jgi:hypothetical protein